MIWTIVPAIVLAVIIIYGLAVWNKITSPVDSKKAIVMELFAEQFKWTARYGGSDNVLGESNYKLTADMNPLAIDTTDKFSWDDKIVNGEFHIPVNKIVLMYFRSKDVIHSAYMPHFRAQMNCVPGMKTEFHFTPTITTAEMREKTKNPDFDYVLLCNKICGATHWNMQMKIVVDSESDYQKWLADQNFIVHPRRHGPYFQDENLEVFVSGLPGKGGGQSAAGRHPKASFHRTPSLQHPHLQ
jgi:cytochrome c oxidase subunit 2